MSTFSYDRNLKEFCRSNRKNQTEAEKKLWIHLRGKAFGHKFRRQFPMENFILDFYCREKKLAIELDGGQHLKNYSYDTYRTKKISQRGVKVIRFWDNEVLNNIEGVLEQIMKELSR